MGCQNSFEVTLENGFLTSLWNGNLILSHVYDSNVVGACFPSFGAVWIFIGLKYCWKLFFGGAYK